MKKLFAISFFMLAGLNGFAQQFHKQFEIQLPDSIQASQPTWVDLDNDGLLDVLLVSKAQSGKSYFQFIKGDTVATPLLHAKKKSVIAVNCSMLIDYNHDNRMDVVVSGDKNGVPCDGSLS